MSFTKTIPTRDSVRQQREAQREAASCAGSMPTREQRRTAAHRGLAECQAAEAEYVALRSAVEDIQRAMDTAADEHVSACRPIQEELARINESGVDRIVAGGSVANARDDQRRSELLTELGTLNATLERKLRDLKASAQPLHARMAEVGKRVSERPKYTCELMGTASPEVSAASRVASRTVEFAKRRYDTAREKAGQYPDDAFCRLELTTAAQLLEAAVSEAREAYEQLLTSE